MNRQHAHPNYIKRARSTLPNIENSLSRLAAGEEVTKLITNIHGLAGIGKTYVLQQIFDTLKDAYDVIWLGFDLKDETELDARVRGGDSLSLVRAPWREVIATLETIPGLKGRIPREITFDDNFGLPIEQMGDILWATALDDQFQRPLLFLIDSLDNLPYWKWVQEQIIKPLLDLQGTLIVCASRTPLFWHYWEIREYCTPRELDGFRIAETRNYLRRYHHEPLAETFHRLTHGYPLVLKQFISHQHELAAAAVPESAILDGMTALQPAAQEILQQIGIMRRVHVPIIVDLLNDSVGQRAWHEPDEHRLLVAALVDMRRAGYIRSQADTADYFAPKLRATLKAKLPTPKYLEHCRTIAQSYYKIAYRHPKTSAETVIEWLYFSTERLTEHADAERSEWDKELKKLFDRIQRVADEERAAHARQLVHEGQASRVKLSIGATLIGWIYTDGELIEKLSRLRLLAALEDKLLPLLIHGEDVAIVDDLRRSCSNALVDLGARVLDIAPKGMITFETALRNLLPAEDMQQGKQYDQADFRERLIGCWPSLQNRPARIVTEVITTMNGTGILPYNRDRRTYAFHPVIDLLLSVATRNRFGVEQAG